MQADGESQDTAMQQLRVGDLLVDPGRALVLRGDKVLPLPGLSFDLLLALARAAPRYLSFDEIMEQVWPGLIVGPDTLSQRVKLLREALSDNPKAPRYVAGVRGRGYRCVAQVVSVDATTPSDSSAPAPEKATHAAPVSADAAYPAPARPRWLRVAAIASVLLLLSLGMKLYFQRSQVPSAPIALAVMPFESPAGTEPDRVLAVGVAEAVLHQLANLPQLSVISRTSAFRIAQGNVDAADIAQQFGVRFVLFGSVQRERERLRITARLVEASSGRNLWSLRFDRETKELFSVQDEIALRVARALTASVDRAGRQRMIGQGTRNIEVYLDYLAGRDALATWRTEDAGVAAAHFARAVAREPGFARGWVMLARARLRDAEFSGAPDARLRLEQVRREVAPMVERSLTLDPSLADAYVERARLRSTEEAALAEQDYRQAIALTPSHADAYQELAALVWQDKSRRREVAPLLDRARALDPLSPEHDVTRAVFEFYGYGRATEAEALLREALARNPDYVPALARLGEVLLEGSRRLDEAIGVLEEALRLDPGADTVRRLLVTAWLVAGDVQQATRLAQTPGASPANAMLVALAQRQLDKAASLAYATLETGAFSGAEYWALIRAMSLAARHAGRYTEAEEAIESLIMLQWTAAGEPQLASSAGVIDEGFMYAGLLRDSGDPARANRLVSLIEQKLDAEIRETGGVGRWQILASARSAAWHQDDDATLLRLEQFCSMTLRCWFDLWLDPLLEPLRGNPRFQQLLASVDMQRTQARGALAGR
jgi:TolB-like protein/DNA-binding winged helix-turn-helix (wHTH) protein/Tfp pilus assembly protein PilF